MKKTSRFIIWVLATLAFTAGICYVFSLFPKYFPFDGFLFAFEVHFLLMAWFAFSTPHLQLDYAWSYFEPKKMEQKGAIYTYFGVNLFRKFLVHIGWEKFTESMNVPVKNDVENLKKREKNTRAGEFSHLVIAILVLLLALILTNSFNEAKWLIVTNILFHIYPIITQRYNRPRYLRAIRILEKRSTSKTPAHTSTK